MSEEQSRLYWIWFKTMRKIKCVDVIDDGFYLNYSTDIPIILICKMCNEWNSLNWLRYARKANRREEDEKKWEKKQK